jgi:hypothetical protein
VKANFSHAGYYDYSIDGCAEILLHHQIFPLIGHCKDDPAQNFQRAQLLVDHFQRHSLPHKTLFLDEGGHDLIPPFLIRAREFLNT